ncbi:MAG TPA: DNA repair helicase XPB [Stenomitos sp.]
MTYNPQNPLIVQSDRSILLEVHHPQYAEIRDRLARFAELVKSPEHLHTYRITPLSLWNAAATGMTAQEMLETLRAFSKFPLPTSIEIDLEDQVARFGRVKLVPGEAGLRLESVDAILLEEIWHSKQIRPFLEAREADHLRVSPGQRGLLKQALLKFGYPVEDLAGYSEGAALGFELRDLTPDGRPFGLRPYQAEAVDAFWAGGSVRGGSGVICLPCGAGKTVVGLGTMDRARTQTLVIVPNIVAVRQWIREILDKTSLDPSEVGEYSGEVKDIRPVTVTTYQVLTHRAAHSEDFPHLQIFGMRDWGLIIYDEVHLLPAPVFRITTAIQAKRRLGLTATLVREDGREEDVFSLIGPKKYDVPWKELEDRGFIAEATCHEIRIPLDETTRRQYSVADKRNRYRISASNPEKTALCGELIERHRGERILVIGQYLDQLEAIARRYQAPLLTGKTPNPERERLYDQFRNGEITLLVVSKVANFAIDLPDASVAIQVSGTFGSRQEEAQRLGRLLRPKSDGRGATFYTLVSRDTVDQEFAANRQMFLTEQGYRYVISNGIPSEVTA